MSLSDRPGPRDGEPSCCDQAYAQGRNDAQKKIFELEAQITRLKVIADKRFIELRMANYVVTEARGAVERVDVLETKDLVRAIADLDNYLRTAT
ncbi:MAG: hypothetical protein K2X77_18455 [Candidatus Obscuribacterales bacterium]|jgi:hypothetical protein|nr:hypothetical protein [Candidatus Obscuribacterales bacterium]